ncbi:MAG TPA: leucyl/phenylalanyl-tRNA--protein transferase [Caulobacteraceae bacterium]|nr:leucyl/phenylalanyl-tRNA--protein transferase [Caulobacteraceae bacterium]
MDEGERAREASRRVGFTADDLLACYRRGVFPMADARHDERVFLVDPARRGVIPLGGFHVSRRLARTIRADRFEVRIDTAFEAVIDACAAPRPGRLETWINGPIQTLCQQLHQRNMAHSVECWREGRLVGGLYGVSVGAAFFGESMFSLERDASKVALAHLVGRLRCGGYRLLDAQFITDHLASFGAVEISRADYMLRLADALGQRADFRRLDLQAPGAAALQAISQAS